MASTSNPKKATSLDKSGKPSPKRSPDVQKKTSNQSKSKGSMGLGLIMLAISTSLVGLGGLGYLVYQELVSALGREVEQSTVAQTQTIAARLSGVSQSVDMTAIAARTLWQQSKPKVATPYQNLLVDLLKPGSLVAGAGIVSEGNLLPPPAKGVSIYIWQEKSEIKVEPAGKLLATGLLSSSRADITNSDWYKQSIAGKAVWSQPYDALGKKLLTYSAPVGDGKTTVAVVNADAIAAEILALNSPDNRIGYVVFGTNGAVITGSEQFNSQQSQNPAIAESITGLAQQSVAQPTGIAQSGGNLWAYRRIGNSGLVVAAYLPQSEIVNKLAVLVGGAAVGISAVLAIAILGFVTKLKKRLQPLVEDCDRFLAQNGNPAISNSGDELEHLSVALKSTLQQVKSSELRLRNELINNNDEDISRSQQVQQSLAETEMIEAEVGDLLDVVSSMEEGDLTIEAQVNDRATGLVADTLNRLREKLVEIISSVLGTAQQVAKGASDLEELAKTVVLNTAEQAQSVIQGQSLTEQVASIAKQSAEQVNVANLSLQEVRDTVADGQTAINTLTESISVLQTGSAQIVQRMKTLGEFVGLAEQFVQDQGQIASLTQVLALNATLVAARAAEQKDPKQFASVAREFESIAGQVNDLATQTNDGLTVLQQRTSQIQTVVTAIDTEVQNLSGLVSGFTEGVESSQAAFNSIQVATEEVVQIGQSITSSSTEIAEAAGTTATYISEIAQLAERTADLTRSARQQAESMGNQAQQLLQGIQFFRLPASAIAAINSATNAAATKAATKSANIAAVSMDESTTTNEIYDNNISDSRYGAIAEENDHELDLVLPTLAVTGAVAGAAALAANHFSDQQDDRDETLEPVTDVQGSEDQNLTAAAIDFTDVTDISGEATEHIFDLDMQGIQDDTGLEINQNLAAYVDPMLSAPVTESVEMSDDFGEFYEPVQTEITDISAIEASLFADLKQEIYENNSVEDEQLVEQVENLMAQDEDALEPVSLSEEQNLDLDADLQPLDLDTSLTDPLEDVNQEAIADAAIDPLIVSATSSFLEDTQFGTPVSLSEEMLANVPASVDFAIPTLEDDDDFAIPPMQIESSLDDSNSFFDSEAYNSLMNSETDLNDPFAISYSEPADNDIFGTALDNVDSEISSENTFDNEFGVEYSAERDLVDNLDENSGSSFTFNLSPEIDEAMDETFDDGIIYSNNDATSDQYPYSYAVDYALEDNFNNDDISSDVDSFNSFTDSLVDGAVDSDQSEFALNFSETLDDDVFEESEESSDEFDIGFFNRLSADMLSEEIVEASSDDFTPILEMNSDDANLGVDLDMGAVDLNLEAIADDASGGSLPVSDFQHEFDHNFEAIANVENESSFELNFADSNELDLSSESELDFAFNLEEGNNIEINPIINSFDDVSENEFTSLSMIPDLHDEAVQDFSEANDEPMYGGEEFAQISNSNLIDEPESDFNFDFSENLDDPLSNDLDVMIASQPTVELATSVDAIELDSFTDDMDSVSYNFGAAIEMDENHDFSNNVISDAMVANAPDPSYAETSNDGFDAIMGLESFNEDSVEETDDVTGFGNIFSDLGVEPEIDLLEDSIEIEDFTGEDDLEIISEVNPISESGGLDFSDSWLDDIIDDKLDDDDDTSAIFGAFPTVVPSLDDFAKPPVSSDLDTEDSTEFDFSAFDDLSNLLQPQPVPPTKVSIKPEPKPTERQNDHQIAEAQSEIDAFLSSGVLENDETP